MSASSKIFAGSRLRRLRLKLGLSQAAFAQSLGLSASYLNLMERDQRPLTAQVVLKLSGMEGVDVAELAAGEAAHSLLQPLREMVADPLLAGEVPPGGELAEALQAAPNFATATLKLYAAYREALKRLADAARGLPAAAREASVDDWLAARSMEDVEGLAEDIWGELTPKDDVFAGLKARLRASFGIDVRILPTTILGEDRSRYDRHSQRLLISEALGFEARIGEAAHLLARLEGKALVEAATEPFTERPEQRRAAKAALDDRLALALLCPRGRFSAAAEDLKLDPAALARRFAVTQGQVMQRVAQMREDMAAITVDATGRILARQGRLPFHLARDEPLCAQLPLFDQGPALNAALMQPAEGAGTIALAMRDEGKAHALFMPPAEFEMTALATKAVRRPLGATCRLCEVRNCAKRGAACATRPAGLNDYMRGPTDFEPV
ncbi:MAG: helix-turn-helix domain-containing protein [Alphaproteobacteria bacterium]|nr:helix-turn-helix domain-containing protein [Alphaproteobacteria bacterium]